MQHKQWKGELMEALSCSLVVAAAHFALQSWPRLLNPFFGVDCWRHMLAAEHIRTKLRLPVDSLSNYLFRGPFDYPPFIPVLLAAFPRRMRLFMQAILSPIFEVIHGMVAFGVVWGASGDVTSAALSQVLFALVPITTLENSQLSARSPGSLYLTLAITGTALFANGGGWSWLVLGLTAGVMTHLTHKMASQTLVLFSLLGLPFLWWLRGVPLVGIVSLGISIAIFPRLMRRNLVGHWAILRYYRAHFAKPAPAVRSVESRGFVGRLVAVAKSNPLVTLIGADPWILLVPLLLGFPGLGSAVEILQRNLLFWLAAVVLLILSTSTLRPLRFLGDGPRYSFYLAFPLAILLGPLLAPHLREPGAWSLTWRGGTLLLGLGILGEILLIQFKGIVKDRERSYRDDVAVIAAQVRTSPAARLAIFPLCTAEVMAFFGECQVLSTDSSIAHAEHEDFRTFNPRLRKPLKFFLDKYDITHVVLESHYEGQTDFEVPQSFAQQYRGNTFTLWRRAEPLES